MIYIGRKQTFISYLLDIIICQPCSRNLHNNVWRRSLIATGNQRAFSIHKKHGTFHFLSLKGLLLMAYECAMKYVSAILCVLTSDFRYITSSPSLSEFTLRIFQP